MALNARRIKLEYAGDSRSKRTPMSCQERDKTAEWRESMLPNWRLPFWQDPVIRRQGQCRIVSGEWIRDI